MANVVTRVARRATPPSTAAARRRPRAVLPRARRNGAAWGFLIGAVLCFSFFSWYPIVREFIMSFQKPVYGGGYAFAGWSNYLRIFRDPTFWQAWRNTLEFTILALVLGFALPFIVAIVLNELRHARGYLRALVYLPVMLTPASALLLFAYFYNPQYGLFDDILHFLHLPTSQWVFQPGTGFFSIAMVSVVIASTWMNMGSATLIYLAALQNIPGELYAADQARDHPADQADPDPAADAAGRRHHADVHRVVRADQRRRRRGRQHAVRGDAHLSIRVRDERREQLQQRLGPRRGPHAGPRRVLRRVPVGHP
jgi:ABC-type spermidine/putrescine transport system permease subunit II